jgi:hypothetical protein
MLVLSVGQVYKTAEGRLLRIKTIRECGLHTLETIDQNGNVVPDKINGHKHVIDRCDRFCTEESIKTFKKHT